MSLRIRTLHGMAIRAVIFDLDCTLTCRRSSIRQAAEAMKRRFAPHLDPYTNGTLESAMWAADHFGYRDRTDFFNEVLCDECWRSHPTMSELLSFWRDDYPQCTVLMSPAIELLDHLRLTGRKLGLITNGHSRTQNAKIRFAGIRERFDHVLVSGDVDVHKPDPEIYRMCLAAMNILPHEAVYVGDHPENDIAGAENAGLHAVWISTGGPWPAGRARPARRIDSLAELPRIIGEIDVDNPA